MRARLAIILLAACHARDAAPASASVTEAAPIAADAAIAQPVPPPRDAAVAVAAADAPAPASPPDTTVLTPVAMDGPYKSVAEACDHAAPCGFTAMTDAGDFTKPATKTSCPALESNQYIDPNSARPEPGIGLDMAQLSHASKELELRIGSESCAEPKGMRGEHDIYFMFVKRADGWWRSAPLWQWSYNDKYGAGTMLVRWNDQPGRTFAGIAAGLSELTCDKRGDEQSTLELMVRVEPGTTAPVVFAPLVVGERSQLDPVDERLGFAEGSECKSSKHRDELTERWSTPDDLELTGTAMWQGARRDDHGLYIGFTGDRAPSSAGRYRFTR